jgi:hypothetical protein
MLNIPDIAGQQVIHAYYMKSFLDEPVTKM